jgi:hypothetical protein
MNLSKYAELNCSANYTIVAVTYDSTGKLTLSVDYSTNMEGLPCTMTLSFDSTIIRSSNITVSFDAVSETLPLLIVEHQ